MTDSSFNFDDIRCYNDDEVVPVLRRLSADKDMAHVLLSLRYPLLRHMPIVRRVLYPLVCAYMRARTSKMRTVYDLQIGMLYPYLTDIFARTCSRYTCAGTDHLDKSCAYLLIGNHRDILVDPLLLNISHHQAGLATLRFGVGDNLIGAPHINDLARLNKSIKVRRNFSNVREAFRWHKHFSAYLRHCIVNDRCSMWIAQSNGRSKDGNDKTDTGLIKMLSLSVPDKSESTFSAHIRQLNIVPVSVSYEYDPCDILKAREVLSTSQGEGKHIKDEHEDNHSIATGVLGWKGRLHIHYGKPLEGDYRSPEALANALDKEIVGNYALFPSNYFAYYHLYGEYPSGNYECPARPFDATKVQTQKKEFEQRLKKIAPCYRTHVLNIYANPLKNQLALNTHGTIPA